MELIKHTEDMFPSAKPKNNEAFQTLAKQVQITTSGMFTE